MKIKGVIGIILIIASIAGVFFWETQLRDKLLLQDVLVAAKDIRLGESIDENSFKLISATTDSIIKNPLHAEDAQFLIGLISICNIKENAQLSIDDFALPEDLDPDNSFTMVIPPEWIYLKNGELQEGDSVRVYLLPEKQYIGTYKVKKINCKEEQTVEIQIPLNEYFSIYDAVMNFRNNNKSGSSNCLLLVSERSL